MLCALCGKSLFAEQYRSEQRILESAPPPAKDVNTEQLLKQTTDPYARALLLRDLAWQAINRKEYDKASKYLEESLALGALAPQAAEQMRKDMLQLQVASGDPAAVIKALEPQVKRDPKAAPEMKAALAGAYLEQKRYKDALPLLEAAIAASPKPEESWLQGLYAAHVGLGQQKEAVPVLEKLLRVNPARAEYWLQLIGVTAKSGNKEKTLGLLELASRLGHLQDEAYRFQLIALTAELGAPFEAGSLMQGWMEGGQLPRSARNWEMLAGLWIEAHEAGLAFQAVGAAIELDPRADLYLVKGQQHLYRDEYPQAAAALASGLRRGKETGPLMASLGMASYYSGNVENAKLAFRDAARDPGAAGQAREWLAFLDTDAAVEQAKVLAADGKAQPNAGPLAQVALSSRLLKEPVQLKPILFDTLSGAPDLRRIGGSLTDVGAEADASADGAIPAWDGGILRAQWPSAFKPSGKLVNPYKSDQPLFTITAANAAQYAGKLSAGHKQLLAQHKSYKMPVYATRRSASYPQPIYDATQANIGKARLIGSDALTGARLGFPFPQPANGVEAMWNHRTRYRGDSHVGITSQAVVGEGGVTSRLKGVFRVLFRYGNIKNPADISKENMLVYGVTYLGESLQTKADFVALFHETANSMDKARGIWVMINRMGGKMLRIPPVGYDQPFQGSEGLYFIDMIDMYNGAFDRYVWKLVGKRELYIPYNSYTLADGSVSADALLKFPTIDQDKTRYELHRVWVIEATERGGKTHAFGKRVFYLDEDSWNAVLVENFDHEGRPWRFQEGHLVHAYDIQSTNALPIVTYDFKENRYFIHRLLAADDPALQFNVAGMDSQDFLPAAVKRKYSK